MNEPRFDHSDKRRVARDDDMLRAPVAFVKGVGPARAEALARLGITRARDLLFYFPRDYVEVAVKRDLKLLDDLSVQSVVGVLDAFQTRFTRRGPLTSAYVSVGGSAVQAIWFNAPYVANAFRVGRPLMITGKPKRSDGVWTFTHPSIAYLDADLLIPYQTTSDEDVGEERYVLPAYHLTEGISQAALQRIMKNALVALPDQLPEALPEALLAKRGLPRIAEAVRGIHFPAALDDARYARRRFAYQELLVLQLALALCRARRLVNMRAPVLERSAKIDGRIRRLFPFEFTDAQNRAVREISEDMSRPSPMNRLLQGDVGSGKTAVAIYAALQAVANGAQAVLMAPTEVLARQHLRTLEGCLRNASVKIAPLFGGQKPSERAAVLRSIESGEAQIVVGTQALVCNEIKFYKLGLVIIDEQHKFGVRQRASLKSSTDLEPHYLVMTATPIPRSVTMTLFGDLDVSVMRGTPPGRQKTTTSILTESNRAKWWEFVRRRLDEGRQAYVVAPRLESGETSLDDFEGRELRRIENDGTLSSDFDLWNSWDGGALPSAKARGDETSADAPIEEPDGEPDESSRDSKLKTVWSVYNELSQGELRDYRLAVMHGRMPTQEKESIMSDFRSGKIQVIIATSVVEVGVDVPNATIMTIENADRFGLAQLHQLRGRITRGSFPGFCAVVPTDDASVAKPNTDDKGKEKTKARGKRKSDASTAEEKRRDEALERLRFFANSTDGFELAEKDFELRGPGELFGSRQHGASPMLVANLLRDRSALDEAVEDAREMVAADPGLAKPEHAILRRQVLSKYGRELDLGDVG